VTNPKPGRGGRFRRANRNRWARVREDARREARALKVWLRAPAWREADA
jgi:hypothetical protein